jgi:hypothetical protein
LNLEEDFCRSKKLNNRGGGKKEGGGAVIPACMGWRKEGYAVVLCARMGRIAKVGEGE